MIIKNIKRKKILIISVFTLLLIISQIYINSERIINFGKYNNSDFKFIDVNRKIEIKSSKKLNLYGNVYSTSDVIFRSNHPEIIKVNNEGIIYAIRPGNAIITAQNLHNKIAEIKVTSICNKGLINKSALKILNIEKYNNLMIVAHPDDETLWGGANLIKDDYFVVCLTNGYNKPRANDFMKIMKFTNNSGIILDYPDVQDNIRDDWSEVENGIINDLSMIINYKYWNKIVTHEPEGNSGHIHHKKICKYVTTIVKKYNKYNKLYYFGKLYDKEKIPKNLLRISDKELEYKKHMVELYISKKEIIYKLWYHMLPYENLILATKWRDPEIKSK